MSIRKVGDQRTVSPTGHNFKIAIAAASNPIKTGLSAADFSEATGAADSTYSRRAFQMNITTAAMCIIFGSFEPGLMIAF